MNDRILTPGKLQSAARAEMIVLKMLHRRLRDVRRYSVEFVERRDVLTEELDKALHALSLLQAHLIEIRRQTTPQPSPSEIIRQRVPLSLN